MEGHGINVSGSQMVYNFFLRLGFGNIEFKSFYEENYRFISILILFVLMVGAFLSADNEKWLFGLYAMQLVPSISWGYTRVWVVIGMAILILRIRFVNVNNTTRKIWLSWWLIIILNSTVLIILNFWPVNILPFLSFVLVILLVIYKIYARFSGKKLDTYSF